MLDASSCSLDCWDLHRQERYAFVKAKDKLDELGVRIGRVWGLLSHIGAHATKLRLKFASYELDGEPYDRMGSSLDPESAELALALVPDICIQLLNAFEEAYRQDGVQFPEVNRLTRLFREFERLPAVVVPDTETTKQLPNTAMQPASGGPTSLT